MYTYIYIHVCSVCVCIVLTNIIGGIAEKLHLGKLEGILHNGFESVVISGKVDK